LAGIGGDLPTLEASGQLIIISDIEFYLKDGLFEPGRSIDLMRSLLEDGRHHGYTTMRLTSDIPWTHERPLDPALWEKYEIELNQEQVGMPVASICQYDRRRVTGGIIVAALRTHRFVIMDGSMRENPFYQPVTDPPVPVS
jgi:hypothetical protein